jgi:hypothetical protein
MPCSKTTSTGMPARASLEVSPAQGYDAHLLYELRRAVVPVALQAGILSARPIMACSSR